MANLPPEIIHKIFSNLNWNDLKICASVCRGWEKAANEASEMKWKAQCKEDFGEIYEEAYRKSRLCWEELYKSLRLWPHVKASKIYLHYSDLLDGEDGYCPWDSRELKKIQVLKNGIIGYPHYTANKEDNQSRRDFWGRMGYSNSISYYDPETLQEISRTRYDFEFDLYEENDDLIVLRRRKNDGDDKKDKNDDKEVNNDNRDSDKRNDNNENINNTEDYNNKNDNDDRNNDVKNDNDKRDEADKGVNIDKRDNIDKRNKENINNNEDNNNKQDINKKGENNYKNDSNDYKDDNNKRDNNARNNDTDDNNDSRDDNDNRDSNAEIDDHDNESDYNSDYNYDLNDVEDNGDKDGTKLCIITKANKQIHIVGGMIQYFWGDFSKFYLVGNKVFFMSKGYKIWISKLVFENGVPTIKTTHLAKFNLFPALNQIEAFAYINEDQVNVLTNRGNIFSVVDQKVHRLGHIKKKMDNRNEVVSQLKMYGFDWSSPDVYKWISGHDIIGGDWVAITHVKKATVHSHGNVVFIGTSRRTLHVYYNPYVNGQLKLYNRTPTLKIDLNAHIPYLSREDGHYGMVSTLRQIMQIDCMEIPNGHRLILLYCQRLVAIEFHNDPAKRPRDQTNNFASRPRYNAYFRIN